MTECERLIANGTFTRDFFKPEVRCDFLVTEKRKKIWAIEIDLLLQLDRVCRKHGLRYWIEGGTLIGAIRHKGFIPWDDDIDVLMFRDDYEKLRSVANEFDEPYFFQTPYTDAGYFFSFTKIRNSNTSAISWPFLYHEMNHGIPIDIFVMDDHLADEDAESRFNEIKKLMVSNSTYMRMEHPYLDVAGRKRVAEYQSGDPLARYELVRKLSMRDNGLSTHVAWVPTGGICDYPRYVFCKEDFARTIECEFEGFKFPAPCGYDRVLTTEYGDYMEMPPLDKRCSDHSSTVFNPEMPYRELVLDMRKQCEKGFRYDSQSI